MITLYKGTTYNSTIDKLASINMEVWVVSHGDLGKCLERSLYYDRRAWPLIYMILKT